MSTQSQNIVSTLKRFVRRISAQQGDVATSAFSLAMLVFLVQKAQAASIADTPLDVAPTDKAGLDQVRQLFGNAAQDSVAGIDYSAIVDALADIQQRYEDASWLEEQAMADMATDTDSSGDAPSADAELATVESYLQDAVQYAQASQATVVPESTDAAAAQTANVDGTALGGASAASGLGGLSNVLPFLLGGVALAGGGGGGTSEIVVTPSGIELTEVKGTVINGYVAKATVFQDLNGNNKWDEGEPKTETGADGGFTLKEQLGSKAPIVIYGGTDLSTGLAYSNILKAPPGAHTITPLTTLVSALMASGKSQADAVEAVVKAFDLPVGTDLLDFDPVNNADNASEVDLAVKVKAAGVLVANLMDSGGSALAGASGGDASAFSYNIAQTIASKITALSKGETLDLGNAGTLKSILTDSASSANLSAAQASKFNAVSDSAAEAIATVNGTIQAAATDSNKSVEEKYRDFAKGQTVAQGALSEKIKAAADAGSASTIPNEASVKKDVAATEPPNHAPSVSGPLLAMANEGATTAVSLNLLDGAKDSDAGATASLKADSITYKIGTAEASDAIPVGLSLSGGVLTVNPKNAAFNHLAEGETQIITVSYKISDGHGGTVEQTATITITGKSQTVSMTYLEAVQLLDDRNYYSADDVVTLNINASDVPVDRLTAIANLKTLGVDFVDIGVDGQLHITAAQADEFRDANIAFVDGDTISLDLATNELFAPDVDDQSTGSYLGGALTLGNAVFGATGLELSELHALGVDLIDIGGIEVTAKLHISTDDANAVHNNDLGFASNDQIVLDINPESINSDESASGSYLNGTLDDAIYSSTGLHLTDLQKLGVDLIDIGGSDTAATLHISAADAKAMKDAGLHFATADHISTDGADYSTPDAKASAATAAAVKPASMLGDSFSLQALGAEHVVVDSGVMVTLNQETKFALSADHSLNDLLIALGDSGIVAGDLSDSQDFVASVAVGADADIAINDSMVKALLDAGMLSVDKASTIEVDTDSEHMSTSLLQLVDIGTDKVVTSQDKAYADLGDVSDLGQLSNLLSSSLEDSADTNLSTLFVHQTDGESVQEVGLVLTADQVGLATEIEGNTSLLAQLTHVGITELLVATDDGVKGDVQLLGHEYHKQPIA